MISAYALQSLISDAGWGERMWCCHLAGSTGKQHHRALLHLQCIELFGLFFLSRELCKINKQGSVIGLCLGAGGEEEISWTALLFDGSS